jgi:transposase
MRVSAPLALRPGDAAELRSLASSRRVEAGLARRARIILLAADGLPHTEIAVRVGVSVPTVREWRARYASGGIPALQDLPRSGRPKTVDEVEIVVATMCPPPDQPGMSCWTSRRLAGELGISPASVVEVWHKWGLKPWRRQGPKFATNPPLEARICEVTGIYLSPLECAVVVCVDEGVQVAAPGRNRRILHSASSPSGCAAGDRLPQREARVTAALRLLTAKGWDVPYPPDRQREFVEFLDKVVTTWPGRKLHVVCDCPGVSHRRDIARWLDGHPHVLLHFAPADSWLMMLEVFFLITAREAARRRARNPAEDLIVKIGEFAARDGRRQAPFVWIKSTGEPAVSGQKGRNLSVGVVP